MKTRVFTILFLIAICTGLSVGLQTRMSRVAGVVLDTNEARIVGAKITVEDARVKRVVRSDDEGKFEVDIPAGTYNITVEQPGFKKFQLPGFRVETSELLNIHMEVEPPQLPRKVH
jgi:hypothetical protein